MAIGEITIKVSGTIATYSEGGWACDMLDIQRNLETLCSPDEIENYCPDMALCVAEKAVELFDAEIIESDPIKRTRGRVY